MEQPDRSRRPLAGLPAVTASARTSRETDLRCGIDALDQIEGALGTATSKAVRIAPRSTHEQFRAEFQATLAQFQQSGQAAGRFGRDQLLPLFGNDGAHRLGHLVKRGVHQSTADLRERLAFDTPGDLIERPRRGSRSNPSSSIRLASRSALSFGMLGWNIAAV